MQWGQASSRSPLPPTPFVAPPSSQQEESALSISDQRTLYLVNIFVVNTARFLNRFSAICQDKLADVHRRILRLDATLRLLEAKLESITVEREFEESDGTVVPASFDSSMPQNPSSTDGTLEPPCG